jgi:alkaline phosphatase
MRFAKARVKRILAICCLVVAVLAFTQEPRRASAASHGKNVILLIADGAGYNHFLAANYYQYGAAGRQVYDSFKTQVPVSTYEYEWKTFSEDGKTPVTLEQYGYDGNKFWSDFGYAIQTNSLNPAYINTSTDSASAATAMATGFKTRDGAIGVDQNGNIKTNIVEYLEGAGKATGLVTSVPFSHATPAGFGAHNISRDNYATIANQLIYSSGLEVLMGCSAPDYDYNGKAAATSASRLKYAGGADTWADIQDGSVLAADSDHDGIMDSWSVIRDKSEFQAMATGTTPKRVLGIPKVYQSLQYYRDPIYSKADAYVDPMVPNVPTLEEMTKAALNVLDNNQNGFFLMVEGGAVDWAAHFYQPGRMIEEMVDFNHSVEAVVNWVEKNSNWDETVVIVTADHETSYLWGPGSNPAFNPIVNNGAGKMPGMQFYSDIGGFGWHSNSLVPLYAKGGASRIFNFLSNGYDPARGSYIDNTDIFSVIQFLMGL